VDDDSAMSAPPEVTIEPADNGHVVRWHQRSSKKDTPGRTVRRVASTVDEALGHAKSALGGGGGSIPSRSARSSKKKSTSTRDGQLGSNASQGDGDSSTSPAAHSQHSPHTHPIHSPRSHAPRSARRRRPRIGGRR
jgi:hypothetical protein